MGGAYLMGIALAATIAGCGLANDQGQPIRSEPESALANSPGPTWSAVDGEVASIIRNGAAALQEILQVDGRPELDEFVKRWTSVLELARRDRSQLLELGPTCAKLAHGYYLDGIGTIEQLAEQVVAWADAGADPDSLSDIRDDVGNPLDPALRSVGGVLGLALDALSGCHP